jgi:hypothetical protein
MKRSLLALSILGAVGATASTARADDARQQCADSYEKAQYLQRDGKLTAARAQLLVCARESCPAFVRTECAKWLGEVDASQPSVIFAVRDADGHDLIDVRVEIDGVLLTDKLGGSAFPVDPGEHTFRLTRSASSAPIEQRVVVRSTEKNRIVRMDFPREAPAVPTPTSPPSAATVGAKGSLVPSLVVAGVSLASIGVSIGLGISAQSDADGLRASACAPRCPSSDLDPVRTKLIVSDVLLGVGVVGLGVATWLFFARPGGDSPKAALSVGPTPGGANATMRITF